MRKTVKGETDTKNEPREVSLPDPTDIIEINPIGKKQRRYRCGHRGHKEFTIHLWGDKRTPSSKNKECPDCLLQRLSDGMIRCPDCLLPILKGDAVALHLIEDGEALHPNTVTIDTSVVCCLRWLCAPTAAGFVGHWNGKGIDYVRRNQNSVAGEALMTGESQFSNIS